MTTSERQSKTLMQLEQQQKQHDHEFHPDIFNLSYPNRMRHLVFHFAKYTGRLAEASLEDPEARTSRIDGTIADTFVVVLSASDVLQVNLDEALTERYQTSSKTGIAGWAAALQDRYPRPPDGPLGRWWFEELAKSSGRMAKAMESLDHMEPLNVRAVLQAALEEILAQCLLFANIRGLDLGEVVERRWKEIEEKRIL